MKFSPEEKEQLIWGLRMRIHLIETGDVHLSAQDAKNMKRDSIIKPLSADQRQLITDLENLIKKIETEK